MAIEEPREELLKIGFEEVDFETPSSSTSPKQIRARCTEAKGRFPILETLPMTQRIRRMIVEGRPRTHQVQAISDGMLTLRRVGILNAMRGVTGSRDPADHAGGLSGSALPDSSTHPDFLHHG